MRIFRPTLTQYQRFAPFGIDLSNTAGMILRWLEKHRFVHGDESLERLVTVLQRMAPSKRNPAAWVVWCSKQPGLPWLTDARQSWVYSGPLEKLPDTAGSSDSAVSFQDCLKRIAYIG